MMKPDFQPKESIFKPKSPYAFERTEKGPITCHGAAGGVVYRLRGLAKEFHPGGRGQVSNPGDVLIFCQSIYLHASRMSHFRGVFSSS